MFISNMAAQSVDVCYKHLDKAGSKRRAKQGNWRGRDFAIDKLAFADVGRGD